MSKNSLNSGNKKSFEGASQKPKADDTRIYTEDDLSGEKKIEFLKKSGDLGDSSDEEEMEKENREYNLYGVDFAKIARAKELKGTNKDQIVKSFLLHTIGRMVIYSPKIEKIYRGYKNQYLPSPKQTLGNKDGDKINVESLGIQTKNIEDIIALGRLLKRSQVRSYKTIYGYNESREVAVDTKITSGTTHKTQSAVQETLIAGYNGLARKTFPSTDMVNLRGESGKGDYATAYKNIDKNYPKVQVEQFTKAASQVKELKEEIIAIKKLKEEIIKHYPSVNSDVFIAESIRKVCRSEPLFHISGNQEISDKIYALTYLLFKTEVYRSPAALINHTQMLELIISGEMTLKEAFEENQMPMSTEGAIKAARGLEKIYDADSFYQYKNPFKYADPSTFKPKSTSFKPKSTSFKPEAESFKPINLVNKESELMDRWLKFKFGEDKFSEINGDVEKYLPDICSEIYGSLQGFGLSVNSLSTFYRATMERPATQSQSSSFSSSSSLSPSSGSSFNANQASSDSREDKEGEKENQAHQLSLSNQQQNNLTQKPSSSPKRHKPVETLDSNPDSQAQRLRDAQRLIDTDVARSKRLQLMVDNLQR